MDSPFPLSSTEGVSTFQIIFYMLTISITSAFLSKRTSNWSWRTVRRITFVRFLVSAALASW